MLDTVLDIVGIKMNKTMFCALKGSKSNRATQIDEKKMMQQNIVSAQIEVVESVLP